MGRGVGLCEVYYVDRGEGNMEVCARACMCVCVEGVGLGALGWVCSGWG